MPVMDIIRVAVLLEIRILAVHLAEDIQTQESADVKTTNSRHQLM